MKKRRTQDTARARELIEAIVAATKLPAAEVTEAAFAACREYRELYDRRLSRYFRRDAEQLIYYDQADANAAELLTYADHTHRLLPLKISWAGSRHTGIEQVVRDGIRFVSDYSRHWDRFARAHQGWVNERLAADLGGDIEAAISALREDVGRYYADLIADAPNDRTALEKLAALMGNSELSDLGLTPAWPADYDRWVLFHYDYPRAGDFAFVPWEYDNVLFTEWVCFALATKDRYIGRKLWAYARSGRPEYDINDGLYALLAVFVLGANRPPGQV